MKKDQTIFEVVKRFNTEARCVSHLERIRWPHGLECLHCKGKRVMKFHARVRLVKSALCMNASIAAIGRLIVKALFFANIFWLRKFHRPGSLLLGVE